MGFIFNKLTILIILVIVFIMTMTVNELEKFVQSVRFETVIRIRSLSTREVFTNQEKCQRASGFVCDYFTCDSIPAGVRFEDACGSDFKKGWRATDTAIPDALRSVSSMVLTITTPTYTKTLVVEPKDSTVRLTTLRAATGEIIEDRSVGIQPSEITRVITTMALRDIMRYQTGGAAVGTGNTTYELRINADGNATRFVCAATNCPQLLIDSIRTLTDLWPASFRE